MLIWTIPIAISGVDQAVRVGYRNNKKATWAKRIIQKSIILIYIICQIIVTTIQEHQEIYGYIIEMNQIIKQ